MDGKIVKKHSVKNVTEHFYTPTDLLSLNFDIFLNQLSTLNEDVSIKRNQFTDIITSQK